MVTYVVQEACRMCGCLASGVCALILTSRGKTVCHDLEKNRGLGLMCGVSVVAGGYAFQFSAFNY